MGGAASRHEEPIQATPLNIFRAHGTPAHIGGSPAPPHTGVPWATEISEGPAQRLGSSMLTIG